MLKILLEVAIFWLRFSCKIYMLMCQSIQLVYQSNFIWINRSVRANSIDFSALVESIKKHWEGLSAI